MTLRLDHLVVAARTLEEGVRWVESRLGVPMAAGGKHASMGTHNALLSLGPGRYLEVIAIDPEAPAPGRARWFGLDAPETLERLEQGPMLLHWVVRTDDIGHAVAATASGQPDILELSRGEYRWRIAVAPSGRLALDGIAPTAIEWRGRHPADALPESGCRLERLVLRHARAPQALQSLRDAGLAADDPIEARPEGAGLEAHIRTPAGIAELGNNSPG